MSKQILSPENLENEQEVGLRPSYFTEFIGQTKAKENLIVFIEAARSQGLALDHTLLYGPPGLGKTSLAQIISKEMAVNLKYTSGPALTKAADLAAILTNLQKGDILFIDEIHRLNIHTEEILYSAMEDFVLDIVVGEGVTARSVRINLPRFTLVGATTRLGLLSAPLRDRFGITLRLEFYQSNDLRDILIRASSLVNAKVDNEALYEIAKRSRGTPRIALRLLRRVWDFALVAKLNKISLEITDTALNKLDVDKMGLDNNDHRYLKFIIEHYSGGPVGLDTIAAALSEHKDAIEETIEPYLMQIGMLHRTPRGRVVSNKVFEYFGITPKGQYNNILHQYSLDNIENKIDE